MFNIVKVLVNWPQYHQELMIANIVCSAFQNPCVQMRPTLMWRAAMPRRPMSVYTMIACFNASFASAHSHNGATWCAAT